jgi:hypothetical protein
MKTQTLAASALLALFATACSGGGGGSTPAPNALAPVATPAAGSSATAAPGSSGAHATLPAGTVGVTLTIKIPPHKHPASAKAKAAQAKLRAAATLRKPLFIGPNTQGVTAVVTPSGSPALPATSGTCSPQPNPTACSIVIAVPIFVASQVVVTLLGNFSEPIGQATANFTAGQFTEGVANVDASPLVFQPMIAQALVNESDPSFQEGTPNATLSVEVDLFDADNNDVGSETDGVLDQSGVAFTGISLTSSGGAMFSAPCSGTGPCTFSVAPGNPASDLAVPMSYDGSGIPMIFIALTPGSPALTANSFDGTGITTTHGLSVTSGNAALEYGSSDAAFAQGSDTFMVSENIPGDASSGLTIGATGCAAITSFTSGTPLAFQGSGQYSFTVIYNTSPPAYNGVCTLTATDTASQSAQVTIAVNQANITVQRKNRR